MMKNSLRLALPLVAVLLTGGALASCNTVRGAAQDVQAGGNAVEGAANDVQADMQMTEAERAAKEERDRLAAERAAANPN
jgi:predicted small secreted protein